MLHDRVLPEPQTRPADVRKRWVPGRGQGSLAPRHPAGGRMRAGPGGTDGASAADHGEDRRRVGTRATSPTVPGAGRGARCGEALEEAFTRGKVGGLPSTRAGEPLTHSPVHPWSGRSPTLRHGCGAGGSGACPPSRLRVRSGGRRGTGHTRGRAPVCLCRVLGRGADSGRAGWDVLAGGGGPRQAATCRRGAAEGRAEKVTCDNGLREPKSSVWPQAAAVSSERLAVGPRPRASVSWVSQ